MPHVRGSVLPRQYERWSVLASDGEEASGELALADAAGQLPVSGAELTVWPGPVEVVAERFRRRHPHGLVLVAIVEQGAPTAESG